MSSLRILTLSSSRVSNSGYLEKAAPMIHHFLGSVPLQIAFVPFASVDNDYAAYTAMVKEGLSHLPHTILPVEPGTAEETLASCDVVMVGGGNTFKLLHDIYAHGLFETIRQKVEKGMPYVGWSAGANIAGRSIMTTNDMPVIEPESFRAFGFLPFQLNPHYVNMELEGHHGETRDQRLAEFVKLNPTVPVVGLPEGTALLREGNGLTLQGLADAVLFERGREPGTWKKSPLPAGSDLSFLLQR